ncbi:MAG: methyltransferase regulatory domain-containing protein [Planctomycetes bacterium]|nr:methyltransferase regulatory domain-containing protein [Planctomycetota bacterium]
MSPDSYADVPYPTAPVRCTHPEILSVLGALSGLQPGEAGRCRVLEIGCGDGGNLLPMACTLPGAEFVGIEPSGPAVDRARSRAEALGLRNATFEKKGVEALDGGLGRFDYILTHGVFSWVDSALQEKILEVSRRLLRPDGLAYVSYNTYPGWHARGMIREMMLYQVRNETSPAARTSRARDFLARLSDAVGATEKGGQSATDLAAFGSLLRHEREMLARYPDAYFYHEHLERVNLPLYFHEFAERAARHGLRYVSEALYSSSQPVAYPAALADAARDLSRDPLELQQLLDFATNRAFRQSVLCASERNVARAADPAALRKFWVSSPVRSVASAGNSETFAVPWGWALTTGDAALRAALSGLGERWPAPIAFADLETTVRERSGGAAPGLADSLLDAFARGMIEFQSGPARFTTSTEGRPAASALARLQAQEGGVVTNLRHEQVSLDDLSRAWLLFLDGTRGERELLDLLSELADGGKMAVNTPDGRPVVDPAERRTMISEAIRLFLRRMADAALLEAPR